MDEKPKTIQERIDELVKELETNGVLNERIAAELPAAMAAIQDADAFELVAKTFKTFRDMWAKNNTHPEIAQLFGYLGAMIERERVRRGLAENIQVGWLEKMHGAE
jgi:hypothetical protein